MPNSLVDDMKRLLRFAPRDAAILRATGPEVGPAMPAIRERLDSDIFRAAEDANLLTGGPEARARLQEALSAWLENLFSGTYGQAYFKQHSEIGHLHLHLGLPQYYLSSSLEIVWQELERYIRQANLPESGEKLRSLRKLLALEMSSMLAGYNQAYAVQVRHDERSAVQERLTRAEHLAEIGHLAASLAHEIKNPLAGISGAIQVIRDAMPPNEPHRPIIAEILRQINRLDGTVKDLLVYARPKPPKFKRCDLPRVIERILTVLRGEPELQRIELEYINSRLLPLFADEVQIEQLVMNLLLNAAQASRDGGLVRLKTTSNSTGFRLEVEDQGHGMPAEICQRGFEPFFTTKAKGTGLGLPICQKIVEAHGGTISIRSTVGEGTTVTVQLPRYPPAASGATTDENTRADR
ncbi:MAG: hypothetical protein KKB50_00805 [Planctomycetes bacterium]|nr:hypothetical protein [Planctomycetota bacterium]